MRDMRKESTGLRHSGFWSKPREMARALGAFALLAVLGSTMNLLTKFGALLAQAESVPQLLFDFTNDPWGALLFVIGLIGFIILALALSFHWVKGQPKAIAGGFIVLAVLMFIGFLIASGITTTPAQQAAPAGATLAGYILNSALPSGCSVNNANPQAPIETCDVVYNYSANCFFTSTSNASSVGSSGYAYPGSAGCGHASGAQKYAPSYILLGIHVARTDALNSTYGFTVTISSIPTITTTSTTYPTLSPIVGYVPATSSAASYWLTKPNAGSLNGQYPPQSAPSVTTGVGANVIGISAFGSTSVTYNETLPGNGGAPAPFNLYTAMPAYATYSQTWTFQNASPVTYTLEIVVIGEHA